MVFVQALITFAVYVEGYWSTPVLQHYCIRQDRVELYQPFEIDSNMEEPNGCNLS